MGEDLAYTLRSTSLYDLQDEGLIVKHKLIMSDEIMMMPCSRWFRELLEAR